MNINLGSIETTTDNIKEKGKRIKIHFYHKFSTTNDRSEYILELSRGQAKYLVGALKAALKMTEYRDF